MRLISLALQTMQRTASAFLRDIGMQTVETHTVTPCKHQDVSLGYRQPVKQHLMQILPQHFIICSLALNWQLMLVVCLPDVCRNGSGLHCTSHSLMLSARH